jgi:hypothetical protein
MVMTLKLTTVLTLEELYLTLLQKGRHVQLLVKAMLLLVFFFIIEALCSMSSLLKDRQFIKIFIWQF